MELARVRTEGSLPLPLQISADAAVSVFASASASASIRLSACLPPASAGRAEMLAASLWQVRSHQARRASRQDGHRRWSPAHHRPLPHSRLLPPRRACQGGDFLDALVSCLRCRAMRSGRRQRRRGSADRWYQEASRRPSLPGALKAESSTPTPLRAGRRAPVLTPQPRGERAGGRRA